MVMAAVEVSSIRDVFEALERDDPAGVDDESLASVVLGLQVLQNWVEARAAVWVAEFQQRARWAADGSRSVSSWVEERTHTPAVRVAAQAKLGRALRHMPATATAASAGELSVTHCRLLMSCLTDATKAQFAQDEEQLVGYATTMRAKEFNQVVRVWAAHADPNDDTLGAPDVVEVGQVFLNQTFNGSWALKGTLNPEHGAVLNAAVDAEVDRLLRARRDGDPTTSQLLASALRAEALVNLVCQTMRQEPSERSVPDRYRIAVIFNAGDEADSAEFCDCSLYRAVKDTNSEILDIGRLTRRWPEPIRRAITLRDSGCVFPGCDRPPSWCDVHHCQNWEHDGPTSINNGALLCRHHHTFLHKNHWTIAIEHQRKPVIRKPDGTIHHITKHQMPTSNTG